MVTPKKTVNPKGCVSRMQKSRIVAHPHRNPHKGFRSETTGVVGQLPEPLTQLDAEGIERAQEIGRKFQAEGYQPKAIICSPLFRTQQTLAEMLSEWSCDVPVQLMSGFDGKDPEAILATMAGIELDDVLIVGHSETPAAPMGVSMYDTWPGGVYSIVRKDDGYEVEELSAPSHFTPYKFQEIDA